MTRRLFVSLTLILLVAAIVAVAMFVRTPSPAEARIQGRAATSEERPGEDRGGAEEHQEQRSPPRSASRRSGRREPPVASDARGDPRGAGRRLGRRAAHEQPPVRYSPFITPARG